MLKRSKYEGTTVHPYISRFILCSYSPSVNVLSCQQIKAWSVLPWISDCRPENHLATGAGQAASKKGTHLGQLRWFMMVYDYRCFRLTMVYGCLWYQLWELQTDLSQEAQLSAALHDKYFQNGGLRSQTEGSTETQTTPNLLQYYIYIYIM